MYAVLRTVLYLLGAKREDVELACLSAHLRTTEYEAVALLTSGSTCQACMYPLLRVTASSTADPARSPHVALYNLLPRITASNPWTAFRRVLLSPDCDEPEGSFDAGSRGDLDARIIF